MKLHVPRTTPFSVLPALDRNSLVHQFQFPELSTVVSSIGTETEIISLQANEVLNWNYYSNTTVTVAPADFMREAVSLGEVCTL